MARTAKFDVPTDTSQFTALQLQPKTLLSLSWNGYARWLKENIFSFPSLIKDHQFGTVILGIDIDYEQPLGFFDADTLDVEVEVGVRRAGSRMELNVGFSADGNRAAHVRILLCPLEIIDPQSLGAVPTTVPEEIMAKFLTDEVDETSPSRTVPGLLSDIQESGRFLTECSDQFTVHHHLCEVAEQWSFIEVPGIVESVREPMALDRHEEIPELRQSLDQRIRTISVELNQPYFVFESGQVETKAYLWRERLVFVHRLLSGRFDGEVHGTIIEQFSEKA